MKKSEVTRKEYEWRSKIVNKIEHLGILNLIQSSHKIIEDKAKSIILFRELQKQYLDTIENEFQNLLNCIEELIPIYENLF